MTRQVKPPTEALAYVHLFKHSLPYTWLGHRKGARAGTLPCMGQNEATASTGPSPGHVPAMQGHLEKEQGNRTALSHSSPSCSCSLSL